MTIPYTRDTWVDDTTSVTAARMNNLEDGVHVAQRQPTVRVYHNTTQSPADSTDTALTFNTERWDTAGGSADTQHDVSTNPSRLTCRYAGKYQVIGHAEFAANTTGVREAWIRINATASQKIGREQTQALTASVPVSLNVSTVVDLAVNDYVELWVRQNSGGALAVAASSATVQYGAELMMYRIG